MESHIINITALFEVMRALMSWVFSSEGCFIVLLYIMHSKLAPRRNDLNTYTDIQH